MGSYPRAFHTSPSAGRQGGRAGCADGARPLLGCLSGRRGGATPNGAGLYSTCFRERKRADPEVGNPVEIVGSFLSLGGRDPALAPPESGPEMRQVAEIHGLNRGLQHTDDVPVANIADLRRSDHANALARPCCAIGSKYSLKFSTPVPRSKSRPACALTSQNLAAIDPRPLAGRSTRLEVKES